MTGRRIYKSIYFSDAASYGKKKNDVTLSFSRDEDLYTRISGLSSSEIRTIIGVTTYGELIDLARREHRTTGNLIKHRLTLHFEHE